MDGVESTCLLWEGLVFMGEVVLFGGGGVDRKMRKSRSKLV